MGHPYGLRFASGRHSEFSAIDQRSTRTLEIRKGWRIMIGHLHPGKMPDCLSRRLRRLFLLLVAASLGGSIGIVTAAKVSAASPTHDEPASSHETSRGSLVICGGGALPGAVYDRFLELAGGPQAR